MRFIWVIAVAATIAVAGVTVSEAQEPEQDVTPPVLNVPDRVVVPATGELTVVTWEVTVTDDQDPNPVYQCYPTSGETFHVGSTTVHCDASDAAGNMSGASFEVYVQHVQEQLLPLRDAVAAEPGVAQGFRKKLLARLDTLLYASAETYNICSEMRLFIRQLKDGRKRAGISSETAKAWVAEMRRIGAVAGC